MKKLLLILLICGAVWQWNSSAEIDRLRISELPSDQVALFATKSCHICKKAKKYFEDNGINYYEYDVEASAIAREEYSKLSNRRGVPLIYYKGNILLGFNKNRVRKLLGKT